MLNGGKQRAIAVQRQTHLDTPNKEGLVLLVPDHRITEKVYGLHTYKLQRADGTSISVCNTNTFALPYHPIF